MESLLRIFVTIVTGLLYLGNNEFSAHGFHFSYVKNLQREWALLPNSSCGGKHQSPVHINATAAISMPIPALELLGFNNLLMAPLIMNNNGHSVQLLLQEADRGSVRILGALLEGTYKMELLHFHWGDTNCRGSEHVISHVRFPLEMHIVFYKQSHRNFTEASRHRNGLVVLAFLFQIREKDYKPLNPIISQLDNLIDEGKSVLLNRSFTLSSILTRDMQVFYTYRGSLTTPPCSEAVTWIVFPDPLPISYLQMEKFRLMKTHDTKLVDNFRHLQHLGSRKIFVRRGPSFNSFHRNDMKEHLNSKFWE